MKRIAIKMTYDADIAEVPDFIEADLKKYQRKFDKWLYDKSNKHKYWVYKDGRPYGVSFRGDAFVEYLNEVVLCDCDEKASIIEMETNDYDDNVKSIFF